MIKIGIKSIILSESRYITESKKCTKMTFLYKKRAICTVNYINTVINKAVRSMNFLI